MEGLNPGKDLNHDNIKQIEREVHENMLELAQAVLVFRDRVFPGNRERYCCGKFSIHNDTYVDICYKYKIILRICDYALLHPRYALKDLSLIVEFVQEFKKARKKEYEKVIDQRDYTEALSSLCEGL